VVTPGSGGSVNFVDLGRAPSPGDSGRPPQFVAALSLLPPGSTQAVAPEGVAVNTETHQVLLADPNGPAASSAAPSVLTFSLLNNTPASLATQLGFAATGVDSLDNVGIAVNPQANIENASIFDLVDGLSLQTVTVGSTPIAVAVDQVTGQAVVVNQGNGSTAGSVSIVSLGAVRQLHISEASPAITFGPALGPLTLTINGSGFTPGSQVLLDGAPITIASVSPNGRQIIASVPANLLALAHRFVVTVDTPGMGISNATDLAVIQPVSVGNSPFGVAVDTDRDLAVVTNSGDGTVSLVQLTTGTVINTTPISVGGTPEGVAVIPRLGLAVVANNTTDNISVVDETLVNGPNTTGPLCATTNQCVAPAGIAINQDIAEAAITSDNETNLQVPTGNVNFFSIGASGTSATLESVLGVFQSPQAVAYDPALDLVAVADGFANVQVVDAPGSTEATGTFSGFANATGIVFDPLNQVFLVANNAGNDVIVVDPNILTTPVAVPVGVAPTAIDYNFQTSTLVTLNADNTMSIIAYLCPPNPSTPASCPFAPQVTSILGITGSQAPLQFGVAVDPKLNMAVVVDPGNHRVLLVPLPN
jgi:DNA-binding beta-propeller fold protein YncE